MAQLTKQEMKEKLGEVELQNLRMQTVIADLRKRNGDLAIVIQEVAPEFYEDITPMTTYNRYARILKLVETCMEWVETANPNMVGVIRDQSICIRDFYAEHRETRKVLSPEHIAAMQAGRKKDHV